MTEKQMLAEAPNPVTVRFIVVPKGPKEQVSFDLHVDLDDKDEAVYYLALIAHLCTWAYNFDATIWVRLVGPSEGLP